MQQTKRPNHDKKLFQNCMEKFTTQQSFFCYKYYRFGYWHGRRIADYYLGAK
jgi:hypothetical protein